MMFSLHSFLACLLVVGLHLPSCSSSRVLLIPSAHYSYINAFTGFGKTLIAAGHEVHMFTLEEFVPKVEKAGMKPVSYTMSEEGNHHKLLVPLMIELFEGKAGGGDYFNLSVTIIRAACDSILSNETLWETIKDTQYDLVVLDGIYFCNYIYPYRLGVPYITVAYAHDPWAAGVPAMPSVEPMQGVMTYNPDKMTFLQRTANLLMFLTRSFMVPRILSDDLVKRFAPEMPVVTPYELHDRSDMFLVVLDGMCLDYPRVSAPHYRYLSGGGSPEPPKALPAEFDAFVSAAEDGVIVLAFGSHESIRTVFGMVADKVLEALGGLKERVILQYNATGKKSVPDNVLARQWLPQNDLLGHPKTKLFVSHCGTNSQIEAVYHSVPILCVPFQMEQEYNADRVINHGYGLSFDIKKFEPKDLYDTIRKVIDNKNHSENVKKCSAILKSMPSVQDTFLFWAEHVMRFGSGHLRPASQGMPLYRLFMLDVIAFLVVVLFVVFFLFGLCIRKCFRKCCHKKTGTKKPKQQ